MSEPTSHTALFCESAMSVLAATPPPSPPGYPLITTATGVLMDTIDTTANSGVNSAMALADTIAFSAASPVLRRRHASPFNLLRFKYHHHHHQQQIRLLDSARVSPGSHLIHAPVPMRSAHLLVSVLDHLPSQC
ncbi:hypothetical protein BSLG_001161 [Batrachochytrium salamandrivorans]|nr:hypothetical protein BSLG_001161 [Batrachochytrium salamandrivorans]